MAGSDTDIRNRLLVARLPAMPQILLQLIELCQSEDAGMAELAKLIGNDPGMTTKVLDIANSAAYHRGGAKVGLLQALNVMGMDLIKTLVISESVFQTFNGFPNASAVDLRGFWKRSLTTAVLAREIAKRMGYAQTEEAYLAGLMHDVGRLALLAAAPNEYSFNFTARDNDSLCAAEQRTLQISHTEAGAWMVERWKLDSFMGDAILYHHENTARLESAHPLIRIVKMAHLLCHHDPTVVLPPGAGSLCALSNESLLLVHQGCTAQVKKAAEHLGIDLDGADETHSPNARMPDITEAMPAIDAVQQRLGDEVRNMALTAELGQLFARQKDDQSTLGVVRQTARILFHLEDTIVLLMNGSGNALVGVSMAEQWQRLSEFSVLLSAGGGIAESAMQRRVAFLSRERGMMSVQEEQLMRTFGADCLVCVPLAAGSRSLGMMVAGVPAWRVADLRQRERFLQSFGAQAAAAMDAASQERGEIDRRISTLKDEFKESSRRVVHEVNNPLGIIKNYLGVVDGKIARNESVSEELGIVSEEIDRVSNIISDFASGGTRPLPQSAASPASVAPAIAPAATDINRVVRDLVRLFRESRFLPPAVQIQASMPEQPAEIDGPPDMLKQVLVNLIKNAVEAMPKGGTIWVSNTGVVAREGLAFHELTIKDTGPGLPDAVMAKLFSQVQSSKPGTNRGIGLSIVASLVRKMGGSISCRNSPAGAEFALMLPVHAAPKPMSASTRMRDLA